MDYILLLLVVILFINNQNKGSSRMNSYKNIFYDKNNINRNRKRNSNHLENYYYYDFNLKNSYGYNDKRNSNKKYNERDLSQNNILRNSECNKKDVIENNSDYYIHQNISNEKFDNGLEKNINSQETNKISKKNNIEEVSNVSDENINDIEINNSLYENIRNEEFNNDLEENINNNEVNDNLDKNTSIERLDNKLDKDIEIENYLKSCKENISAIYENKFNGFNDKQQYSLVDIYRENNESIEESIDEYKEKQELLKTTVIENINDNIEVNNKGSKKIIIEEDKENLKSKFNKLKNKYRGINVSVMIAGVGVLEGEIVFDFPDIVALKNKDDVIIFIDESKILSIF